MRNLVLFIIACLVFASCEKVIQIDYRDGEPKLVIDAEVHNSGKNRVNLTMSQALDNGSPTEHVSGATVTLSTFGGDNYIFVETDPGRYEASLPALSPGEYTLTVVHNGDTNTAVSTLPTLIQIDSLTHQLVPGFFGGDSQNLITLNYVDPAVAGDNYRLKAWYGSRRRSDVYYWDDDFFNGEQVDFPLFAYDWDTGDTAVLELLSMDENVYQYFKVLNEGQGGGGPFGTTPGNPVSNISGNAIGVFATYASDLDTIIIP